MKMGYKDMMTGAGYIKGRVIAETVDICDRGTVWKFEDEVL